MQRSSGFSKALTIVMVLECVIIAILLIVNISAYSQTGYYYQDQDYLFSSIQNEAYSTVVSSTFTNRYSGVKAKGDMEDMYRVGDYTYAASLYRVYSAVGDEERAEEYMDRMEDAYDEMGIYSAVVNDINQKFGITDFDK